MKTICFWADCLGERGMCVALYDYAYYNQSILGNKSIILYNNKSTNNNEMVFHKIQENIEVYGIDDFQYIHPLLENLDCDILYCIKYGHHDNKITHVCKSVVHCVFDCSQPHGDVYAGISPWVDNLCTFPVVPHMINLPDNINNLRKELNIPENAVVFGRYGGYEQFNIKYVQDIVYETALAYPHIYFLFMNTETFCESLPNIIHVSKTANLNKKVEFINTCDAMLWARSGGETFGLSIGEFSSKNKPVLCCKVGAQAHVHLLGDKGIYYDKNTLSDLLVSFNREESQKKDWNAYKEYTPEKVMNIFNNVFIEG
jgi:hypothetical protein